MKVHHWLQVCKPARPTFQGNSKSEKLHAKSFPRRTLELVSRLILFLQVRPSHFGAGNVCWAHLKVHHWLQVFKPPRPTFQDNSFGKIAQIFRPRRTLVRVSSLILFSQLRPSSVHFVAYICFWIHHWLQVFKPVRPTFQGNAKIKSQNLRKVSRAGPPANARASFVFNFVFAGSPELFGSWYVCWVHLQLSSPLIASF